MYWFAVALAIAIYATTKQWNAAPSYQSAFSYRLFVFAGSVFAGFILALALNAALGAGDDPDYQYSYGVKLVSLDDGSELNGSFFLGIGTIESRPVYIYYYENGPGRYLQGYVSTDQAMIIEEERTDGELEIWEDQNTGFSAWSARGASEPYFYFRVPVGSVQQEFTLNGEEGQ